MRALTFTAPYGTLTVRGIKPVENRPFTPTTATLNPGDLLAIHQGEKWDDDDAFGLMALVRSRAAQAGLSLEGLPRGALLGTVRVVGFTWWANGRRVVRGLSVGGPESQADQVLHSAWRVEARRSQWLLADPQMLATPIPCQGKQGLWTVPAEHVPALLALEAA